MVSEILYKCKKIDYKNIKIRLKSIATVLRAPKKTSTWIKLKKGAKATQFRYFIVYKQMIC